MRQTGDGAILYYGFHSAEHRVGAGFVGKSEPVQKMLSPFPSHTTSHHTTPHTHTALFKVLNALLVLLIFLLIGKDAG